VESCGGAGDRTRHPLTAGGGDAVRPRSFSRRGATVDASQRQQAASRFVGIGAEQITPGLQPAHLLRLFPVATIGQLQACEGDEVEDPIWGGIDA
jgi:hypothetical protein